MTFDGRLNLVAVRAHQLQKTLAGHAYMRGQIPSVAGLSRVRTQRL